MLDFINFILANAQTVEELDSITDTGNATLDPVYDMLKVLLPSAMGIVFAVGVIYGIVLGVQYSKASGAEEREKIKKRIISAVIGIVVIIALLGILFAIRGPISELMKGVKSTIF